MAVFGKGKRKSKSLDVEAIVATHSNGEPTPPVLDTNMVTPENENTDTKAAQEGIKKAERQMKRDAELEAKYSHIKPGSVRAVPKGTDIDGTQSKGRMCTVVCIDCGAERTVNVQDAFQVKRCRDCTKVYTQAKQKARRAERTAARKAKAEAAATTENGDGNAA